MSNAYAIATVSAVIEQVVLAAAKSVGVASLGSSFERPTRPNDTAPFVHIYLYGVSEDGAKRNADLPTRNSGSDLVRRPQVALALHYLLTFYGDDSNFVPQRILAAVARDLHAFPVLSNKRVKEVIGATQSKVAKSDLDHAAEHVRLTLKSLTLEEMSRLWSVMVQTPYALSLACDAAVVLIDAEVTAPVALPALRRGGEDRGPEAQTAFPPRIDSLWIGLHGAADLAPLPPSLPFAQLGADLLIAGANLGGDQIRFKFKHPELDETSLGPVSADAGTFRLALPDSDPEGLWAAGLYAVTAVVTRDGKEQRSALWPMALAPRVDGINPSAFAQDGGAVQVQVNCRPNVLAKQPALACLSDLEVPAAARTAAVAKLDFSIDPAPLKKGEDEPNPKSFVLFLRVDGVDSQPVLLKPGGGFAFDDAQKVAIDWP